MNTKKVENKTKPCIKQTKLENSQNFKEDSYEKIKTLVEKTAAMQIMADERQQTAEKYFSHLRKKLDMSGAFLKNAKQDIDNIKFAFQRDHIDNIDARYSFDDIDKTEDEIEEEIKCVQQKLNNLQTRLHNLKTKTKNEAETLEETISKTITSLDNASKGIFDDISDVSAN